MLNPHPGIDPIPASFAAISSFDKRRREYRRVGWIYACSNSSFVDPVYKARTDPHGNHLSGYPS